VRAYHRNVARALKARGIDIEDVTPSRRIEGQLHFHLPSAVQACIRDFDLHPKTA
jgi:hypothetical protein